MTHSNTDIDEQIRKIIGDEDWKYTEQPHKIEQLISSKIVAELEHLFDRADGDRSARNYTSIVEQRLKVLKGRLKGGEK